MLRASVIAATGMSAQQLNVEVISNNIANMNTTAYKRRIAEFHDLLYQAVGRDVGTQTNTAGDIAPVGSLVGLGVKNGGIFTNTTQGTMIQTGGTFDLAIQGKGYFQVASADGAIHYSRDGRFSPNQDGILVNALGYTLDPSITIDPNATDVTINPEGEVIQTVPVVGGPANIVISGPITLVNFINEGGLRPVGNNLYSESESSGTPVVATPGEIGFGTLQQRFIETSNVDAVFEITTLITAQRAYELNSRVISTADEMMSAVNQIR